MGPHSFRSISYVCMYGFWPGSSGFCGSTAARARSEAAGAASVVGRGPRHARTFSGTHPAVDAELLHAGRLGLLGRRGLCGLGQLQRGRGLHRAHALSTAPERCTGRLRDAGRVSECACTTARPHRESRKGTMRWAATGTAPVTRAAAAVALRRAAAAMAVSLRSDSGASAPPKGKKKSSKKDVLTWLLTRRF